MSRKRLPQRESAICTRLREARLTIGKSQEYVASRIGIERSTLTNYESGVSPVRCEVALRFCRQLIVSEEWLAAGQTPSLEASAIAHGFNKNSNWLSMQPIFLRQCMDLMSDPVALRVSPGMAFSTAFDEQLSERYKELSARHFYSPRIVFSDNPEPDLAEEFIACMTERWLGLLANEALRRKTSHWSVQRSYVRALTEAGAHLFRKFIGFTGPETLKGLEWLRDSLNDPNYLLGPLHSSGSSAAKDNPQTEISNQDLTKTSGIFNDVAVKAKWPDLKKRLQKATATIGSKSTLAKVLNVDPTQISQWLSDSKGAREPGGEYALQMREWVELQERKT